jgi:hypothetical protein
MKNLGEIGGLYQELGFTKHFDVSGRTSLSDLLDAGSRRGLYGLELADGTCYTGLSVNIANRYVQHLRTGRQIVRLHVKVIEEGSLVEPERQAIYAVEDAARLNSALRPVNIVDAVESPYGVKLATLVSPDEMDNWLRKPHQIDQGSQRVDDVSHRTRYAKRFSDFRQQPLADDILDVLRTYVRTCVPFPNRTERRFWSLSCMPSTNANSFPRLAVVNINTMETLTVGHELRNPDRFWGFVNVSASPLKAMSDSAFRKLERALARLSADIYDDVIYTAAAGDCWQIAVEGSVSNLKAVLSMEPIQEAARLMNSRLMRKGPAGMFSKYHCYDLADAVLA